MVNIPDLMRTQDKGYKQNKKEIKHKDNAGKLQLVSFYIMFSVYTKEMGRNCLIIELELEVVFCQIVIRSCTYQL